MRGDTLMTSDHTSPGTQLWVGRAGIGRLPGKALTWDATRRLPFVVHAASCLHPMILHGRNCRCRNAGLVSISSEGH